MCAKSRELLRSIISNLMKQSGSTYITGAFAVLALCAVLMVVMEQWRMLTITAEASNKIKATITAVAASHIHDSYGPIRDSTSGAFIFDGIAFSEIKDTDSFYKVFCESHPYTALFEDGVRGGTNPNDGYLYEITNVHVFVNNKGSGTTGQTLYRVEYTLTVLQGGYWRDKRLVMPNQVQRIRYLKKF